MAVVMMTGGEIVTMYRQAKHPEKQIGILAQLNACDGRAIIQILKESGVYPMINVTSAYNRINIYVPAYHVPAILSLDTFRLSL